MRNQHKKRRGTRAILVGLVLVGLIPAVAAAFHPYRAVHAQRAREFARRFWPEVSRGGYPLCLRWDLGIGEWNSTNLNVAVYLCNQMIYAPHRVYCQQERCAQLASEAQLLRCISPLHDPADVRVIRWLGAMNKCYRLRNSQELAVNMAEPGALARLEYYYIYEFVPNSSARPFELQTALRRVEQSNAKAIE